MRVTELKPKSEEQTVSWTGNNISYYLHVVDRTRVKTSKEIKKSYFSDIILSYFLCYFMILIRNIYFS